MSQVLHLVLEGAILFILSEIEDVVPCFNGTTKHTAVRTDLLCACRAAARQFAEIGAKLILVARRDDRLQALKKELEEEHKVRLITQRPR